MMLVEQASIPVFAICRQTIGSEGRNSSCERIIQSFKSSAWRTRLGYALVFIDKYATAFIF